MASRVMPLQSKEKDKSDYIENQLRRHNHPLLQTKNYYVNNEIRFGNEYIINGIVFKENITVSKYREFELYKMDDLADTSGVSVDDDTHLQLTLELVPNGFIINSNVYLTHKQWHTIFQTPSSIAQATDDIQCCAVCETYWDPQYDEDHLRCSEHVSNMERYKPLNKYDLSITRKIKNNYHCGVCNVLFNESLKNHHFSSKTHEDKLLFAINRVSDIMYDFNIHNNNNNEKKDSYYFNTRHNNQEDAYMLETIDESDEYEEHNYDYNDDDWYPINYKEDFNDNEEYSDDEPVQNLEFSYASMAKKPKSDDLPDVLEVDFGNKKVTVKFNSWHMFIRPVPNRFYCMACKELDHIRKWTQHCGSETHLARLDACTVVDEYDKYFVRQVDDKFYHCGHCNNLQLINVMEDHIRSVHTHPTTIGALLDSPAKKISSPVKTNLGKTKNNEDIAKTGVAKEQANGKTGVIAKDTDNGVVAKDNSNHTSQVNGNGHEAKIIINPANVFEGLRAANSNFDDIVICAYGSNLKISKLAFNIICQGTNEYYCGLCEVSIEVAMLKYHVIDGKHLTKMVNTPFIEAFNVHLFREIRDALHCGLCNELIQIMPEFIIKHKYLEKHIVSLYRALGHFNTEAKNVAKDSGAIAKPLVAEIPKTANTNGNTHNNNVTNGKTNIDTVKKEPVANNNVALNNIQGGNKVVPANKNICITTINSTKNETVNNKNIKVAPKNLTDLKNGTNINVATKNVQANNKNGSNINVAAKNVQANNKDGANVTNGVTKPANVHNEPTSKKTKEDDDIIKESQIIAAQIKNEEFITVKNGVREESEDDLDDSYIEDFDVEEYVYVKLGNNYIKITNMAYNSLVDAGDGSKYCFVCSSVVSELGKHVESRGHMENMEKIKFVDKYNEDLLRQFYLMYHCSICNVVITRKQLNHHLSWPTHTLQTENTKITSKKRRNEIKTGTKHYSVATQKENIYLNEKETDIKIFKNVIIGKENNIEKLNKIVIFNDNVLKVSFDCWHSLSESVSGYRCKVCQCEFENSEFGLHVNSEWHKGNLEKIEKRYSPALIRKINDVTLNCIMCNTEVSNKKHIVAEHVQGKKHVKQYEAVLKESSVANSYADCDQDVIML